MELLSGVELAIWIKASAFSLAVTEFVKRIIRISGGDLKASTLWTMSILLTALAVTLQFIEHTALTYTLWLWLPIMALSTPIAHKIIVMNGVQFVAFVIKKYTGYELNLKEIASGRSYKLHKTKHILTPRGIKEVPDDYETDPEKGERTIPFRADQTIALTELQRDQEATSPKDSEEGDSETTEPLGRPRGETDDAGKD